MPNQSYSAFGEVSVAEPTPIFQGDFRSNVIRSRVWNTDTVNGSCTASQGMAVCQTSAAANSRSILTSKTVLKYSTGQGAMARFTCIFGTPAAGSFQEVGIGDLQDGFFFGFQGTTFGIIRRTPSRTLSAITSITRSSTTATVTTTAPHGLSTGDIVQISGTAATEDEYVGGFIITVTGESTFTYTVVGSPTTPASGTLKYDKVTDNFTPQSSFNVDTIDGNGPSKFNFVYYTGNVFQIKYQYLGFGEIGFFIENTITGEFIKCHVIRYTNRKFVPSVSYPSLALYLGVRNTTNTTNITAKTASMAGFIEGKVGENGLDILGVDNILGSTITTTETAVITLKNKRNFGGFLNKVRCQITNLGLYGDGNGTNRVKFIIRKNTTLGGTPSYTNVDTNNSCVSYDIAGTTCTGGEILHVFNVGRNVSNNFSYADLQLYLNPYETLTISALSQSAVTPSVSINWKELI